MSVRPFGIRDAQRLQLERKQVARGRNEDRQVRYRRVSAETCPNANEVIVPAGERTEMEGNRVVEPVFGPAVARGDLCPRLVKPVGPRLFNSATSRSSVAKRKLLASIKRRTAINRNIQPGLRGDCSTPTSSKRIEQLVAIEARRHGTPLAQIPAHTPHHLDEARKARGDERRIVDLHGLVARKPHHQRRHRDAVIHVGRDQPAARHAALAVHDQVVALDLDVDAVDRAASRRSRQGDRIPSRAIPSGRACASCLRRKPPRRRARDIRRS